MLNLSWEKEEQFKNELELLLRDFMREIKLKRASHYFGLERKAVKKILKFPIFLSNYPHF